MKTRPGLVQWIMLAAAGGASFFGAAHLVAPDAADDPTESLLRDVSAHPSAAVTEAMVAPAFAPAALPPARESIDVGSAADTFKARSWLPPPPPPPPAAVAAASAPPPPPSAPPLPFRFVGMLELKSDRPTAFLARGEALNVVRVGDVIDNTYRIESLSPAKVVVTYLPLKQQQTLSVDGGQP